MNVLRNFAISVAFYGKIANFSDNEKHQYFFSKNPSTFLKKTQTLNVLRNFTISVAIYGKFATFSDFEKNQYFFFEKPIYFFEKKNPNFERFEKFYCFSRILRQICYLSDFEKIHNIFLKNQSILFKKTQLLNVLRTFTILVAFYGKSATFSDPKKTQYFFSKNPSIFLNKAQFLNVLRNFTFQSHFTANLLPLAILKNVNIFFWKTHLFF